MSHPLRFLPRHRRKSSPRSPPAPTSCLRRPRRILPEHRREIRYSYGDKDGVRYVEIVDNKGQHVASGMGEAADALTSFLLYLLPPDHPDYPKE